MTVMIWVSTVRIWVSVRIWETVEIRVTVAKANGEIQCGSESAGQSDR